MAYHYKLLSFKLLELIWVSDITFIFLAIFILGNFTSNLNSTISPILTFWLNDTSLKSKIESIKNAAELALETIANRMKVERYELDDLLVPDFNLDKNGERIVYAEDKEYKLYFYDRNRLCIL